MNDLPKTTNKSVLRSVAKVAFAGVILAAFAVILVSSPARSIDPSRPESLGASMFSPVVTPSPTSNASEPRPAILSAFRPIDTSDRASKPGRGGVAALRPIPAATAPPEMHAVPTSTWRTAIASSYGIHDGTLGGHLACGGILTDPPKAEVKPSDLIVANLSLPCGTRVEISFRGYTVTAIVRDRGPYIAGRLFDLGPSVARGVHFDGLGQIEWRLAP